MLSLHFLSPDRIFKDRSEQEIESGYGNWQLCTGLTMLLFVSLFMMALPLWFYLGVAAVVSRPMRVPLAVLATIASALAIVAVIGAFLGALWPLYTMTTDLSGG